VQMPGGPKKTHDTLIRRAIDGSCVVDLNMFCVLHRIKVLVHNLLSVSTKFRVNWMKLG